MTQRLEPLHGNHACALAAIAAGCRFFAGYPITPSSEIAEHMSRELPRVDGVFVQMEDEIGSLAAVIGASMGGSKAMTATSGPGFSLMQEHLGYAAMTEVPCVIIDVMRGGPSTGMPTRPGQGDMMQARWGTHGDHPVIAVVPASVQEIYSETIRAFNLAETYRVPVIVLYDEVVAHLLESIEIPDPTSIRIADRKWANGSSTTFEPYAETEDLIPLMARPGDGHRAHVTGLTHTAAGFPTQKPDIAERVVRRLLEKIERHRAAIEKSEAIETGDADVLIVSVGIAARAAPQCRADAARGRASGPGCSARSRCGRSRSRPCARRPAAPVTYWFPNSMPASSSSKSNGCWTTARTWSRWVGSTASRSRPIRSLPRSRSSPVMNEIVRGTFDINDYLRLDLMPHFMCPGCGHGIALRALLWAVHELGIDKNKLAVVSGIGCSGRVGAYIDANTFHTTHGRPLAFATGLKLARPDLTVVVITGDGDCLAIGGNHLIHACRRNLDLTCLMLNNEVYGMTGGQVSPTTAATRITSTTPGGNAEPTFDACRARRSRGGELRRPRGDVAGAGA